MERLVPKLCSVILPLPHYLFLIISLNHISSITFGLFLCLPLKMPWILCLNCHDRNVKNLRAKGLKGRVWTKENVGDGVKKYFEN